jgi:hypothetical protein
MKDLENAILRFAQAHKFDDRLENITLCLEINAIGMLYWVFSQGKLQSLRSCLEADLRVSGTLQQWMELVYNPLQPLNGCQIQGDSRTLQVLKESIQQLHDKYEEYFNKYPLTISAIYSAQSWLQNYAPPFPWASQNERFYLQAQLREAFQRVDRCQWALDFLSRKSPCS